MHPTATTMPLPLLTSPGVVTTTDASLYFSSAYQSSEDIAAVFEGSPVTVHLLSDAYVKYASAATWRAFLQPRGIFDSLKVVPAAIVISPSTAESIKALWLGGGSSSYHVKDWQCPDFESLFQWHLQGNQVTACAPLFPCLLHAPLTLREMCTADECIEEALLQAPHVSRSTMARLCTHTQRVDRAH